MLEIWNTAPFWRMTVQSAVYVLLFAGIKDILRVLLAKAAQI